MRLSATDSPTAVQNKKLSNIELSAGELLRQKREEREKKKMHQTAAAAESDCLKHRLWGDQAEHLKKRDEEASRAREAELEQQKAKLKEMQQKSERDAEREREFAQKEAGHEAQHRQMQEEQRASAANERQKVRDRLGSRAQAKPEPSMGENTRQRWSPEARNRRRQESSTTGNPSLQDDETAWKMFVECPPDEIRLQDIPFPSLFALSLGRRPNHGVQTA